MEKKERKREEERLNDGNNNGQLRIATPPRVAHEKPPGPKSQVKHMPNFLDTLYDAEKVIFYGLCLFSSNYLLKTTPDH